MRSGDADAACITPADFKRCGGTAAADSHPIDSDSLIDAVGGIVWERDPQTLRFRYVSERADRLLGFPISAWLEEANFWVDRLHPDDRERARAECLEAVARRRPYQLDYRMIAADGHTVWLHEIASVFVEHGEIVRCSGLIFDECSRRAGEEVRRSTEDPSESQLGRDPVFLFAVDRGGMVTRCDGQGVEAARADLLGHRIADWSRGTARIRENVRRALSGEPVCDTVEFEGRVFVAHYIPADALGGRDGGLIGVATDITARVREEEERVHNEAQRTLSQKLESLEMLAGGVSHDFNNRLMTILGSADLALRDLPSNAPSRVHVERIRSTARSAADLTDQLLAYSGREPIERRPIDLSTLANSVVDRFRRSLPEGTTLACDLALALPAIDGDESRLIQAITNLLSNSAESLSETGGTIRVTTLHRDANPGEARQVSCAEPPENGSCVMLEVTDSGVGMSDDVIPKIFDPFYSTKSIGRGLGLAAVLGIVRAHRGVIQVNSRPGKGTSVRAFFPSGRPEKVASAAPSRAPIVAREGCTVLLVDDEDGVREVAGEMLRRLGVDVISATDGAEAIQILTAQGEQISAVLLDVTMPKMTGPETARKLRLLQPETPIILMSGYSQARLASRVDDLGVAGFLRKPFLPDALESVLENALSRGAGSNSSHSMRRHQRASASQVEPTA